LASGNAQDDSTYTSIESQLASFTTQRDALVAQILPLLEAARNQPHSAGAKPAVQCAILRGQLVTTNSIISREKLGEEK